jgi:hypothetical protein
MPSISIYGVSIISPTSIISLMGRDSPREKEKQREKRYWRRLTAVRLAKLFGLKVSSPPIGFPPILITALLFPFNLFSALRSLSTNPTEGFIDCLDFGLAGDVIVGPYNR